MAPDVGILFRGRLVRAILRPVDPKTATRRLVKLPDDVASALDTYGPGWSWEFGTDGYGGASRPWNGGTFSVPLPRCPYGGPGAKLWVRETHRAVERDADGVDGVLYKADRAFRSIDNTAAAADRWQDLRPSSRRPAPRHAVADVGYCPQRGSWRPAIHMPRWACRIELEVTSVRVERLQELTVFDAYREGLVAGDRELHGPDMARWPVEDKAKDEAPGGTWANAVDVFAGLWDSINEARAPWASNPWVWVIEFRRLPPAPAAP